MSASGLALRWGVTRPAVGERIIVHLSDVGDLPAIVQRWIGDVGVGASFHALEPELERLLVAKIFTHAYENLGKASSSAGVKRGIWRRLAGRPAGAGAPAWSMLPARAPAPSRAASAPTSRAPRGSPTRGSWPRCRTFARPESGARAGPPHPGVEIEGLSLLQVPP